jgi:bifunctional UDP-N-acetylglucosamine pyrophosphorylase/glucosamine-1-phosphate N-acetyltransferase
MKTSRPKVVHELLNIPMLWYVHQAVQAVVDEGLQWTVVGYSREQVEQACTGYRGRFVHQERQLGTGHAVLTAWPDIEEARCEWCLVVNGDAPLIRGKALADLVQVCQRQKAFLGFVSIELEEPSGYGRVIRRDDGTVQAVIEDKDLHAAQYGPELNEVNAGVYCLHVPTIAPFLRQLSRNNAQGEYYITELVDLGVRAGRLVVASCVGHDRSLLGVNSPVELVACEGILQKRINWELLRSGVTLRNMDQIRISPLASIQPGAEITGPAEIYGQSAIGAEVRIGSHVWLKDVHIGPRARILEFSHLEQAQVAEDCQVGPYARLRPGAELKSEAKVGNFVEVKKAVLESGAKANHLSYIGDARIGTNVNIGAGTITCNYDGQRKHRTVIGSGSFIGSNTALVAPVSIGANSIVGAGSTVSKDVPDNTLAVTRAKQKNLPRKLRPVDDEER